MKKTAGINSNNSIVIDIPEHAEADLTFSASNPLVARQRRRTSRSRFLARKGHVLKVLERAGFLDAFNSDDTKFWLHKEVAP
ncbi:STAS domain-containing protein [Rhizobium sp. LjRoot258]|uniref:STAS domain-containing protein n=1 Tax=Rhizobium sp. LjRoot258 TaxID=3342299 RepID=UPI003ECDFE21